MTTGVEPLRLIAEREHDPGVSSLLTSLLEYLNYLQGLGVLSEDAVRSIYAKVAFRVFPQPKWVKGWTELTIEEQEALTDEEFEDYPEESGWFMAPSIGIEELKRQTYVSESLTWKKTQAKALATTEGKAQLKEQEQGIKLLNAQLNYFVETKQMTPEYALNLFAKSAEGFPESEAWRDAAQARYIQSLETQAVQVKAQQEAELALWRRKQSFEMLAHEQRIRAQARGLQEPERQPGQRPEMPAPATKQFKAMLEQMPPNMRRYYESRLGRIFGEFEEDFPGAREAWFAALHPQPEVDTGEPGMFAQDLAAQVGISPEAAQQTALRFATSPDRGEFAGVAREDLASLAWAGMEVTGEPKRQLKVRDPWEEYLKTYPFAEQFVTLSRSQRGFYPRRFAPTAKWFVS